MSLDQQSEHAWLCKPCNMLFSSWEKLRQHKGVMRRDGKPKHIHCKFCSVNFKTERAEIRHIQENHPKEQNLECPACGDGPFIRLGGLIAHIEEKCPRLDGAILEDMREQKLEFPKKLEALTEQTVKANYTKYMPSTHGRGSIIGSLAPRQPDPFLLKQNEFPSLTTQSSGSENQGFDHFQGGVKLDNEKSSSWNTDKKPFQDAPPARQPTKEQLEEVTMPNVRILFEAMDPNHPNHPSFNSARYYSKFTEKFSCPKVGCTKTFKKAGGLIGHLRSPVHSDTVYRCPYCHRTFSSLAAVTQHAESSGVRCRIRDTEKYDAYLDQLTAGIVDVSRERNDDGTLKYNTTETARETFRPGGSMCTTNATSRNGEKTGDRDPWKGKEIHW
ncbi:hypothetical protein QQZ08_000945 [Neonectria magnoliae]|uniref:C2H2-type domain-containing protein n=1 Tax=Neonectria magnoliae TaxID=2732573 RepID=A0ABR1IFK6_9HYPO